MHYSIHGFFLEPNQVLSHTHKIAHLPAILVHGEQDAICPPEHASLLRVGWSNSQLWMVEGAGHSCMEPAIVEALAKASRALFNQLSGS